MCVQEYEYKVRTGLRYYADECGQRYEYRQGHVIADPFVNVEEMESDAKHKQDSEGPCKNDRKVPFYDMIPKMFIYKMFGCKEYDHQHYDAETCKKDVHPLLVQQVECGAFCFMAMVVMTCMMLVVAVVSFMGMSAVVMSQHTGSQSGNEQNHAYGQNYTFPAEGVHGGFFCGLSVVAAGVFMMTFWMFRKLVSVKFFRFVYQVHEHSDNNARYKKEGEYQYYDIYVLYGSQHKECFVS